MMGLDALLWSLEPSKAMSVSIPRLFEGEVQRNPIPKSSVSALSHSKSGEMTVGRFASYLGGKSSRVTLCAYCRAF